MELTKRGKAVTSAEKVKASTTMILGVNLGEGLNGKNIIAKSRYRNISLTAESEKIHEVGKAIGSVTVGLDSVSKEDKYQLMGTIQ